VDVSNYFSINSIISTITSAIHSEILSGGYDTFDERGVLKRNYLFLQSRNYHCILTAQLY